MNLDSLLYNHFDSIIGFIGIAPTICTFIAKLMEHTMKDQKYKNKNGNSSIKAYVIIMVVTFFIWSLLEWKKSTLVSMPRIEGMMYNDAIQTLNENKIQYINKNVDDPNNWRVLNQSISPNEIVNKNTEVNCQLKKVNNINFDLGDINEDGCIDAIDATIIDQLSKETIITKEQYNIADINKDNSITHIDAQIVLVYYTDVISIIEPKSNQEKMTLEEYYVNEVDLPKDKDN